jgi:DNA-directed RNA polymerase specialized sigma24 family protein
MHMQDRDVVAAIVAGDPAGLAEAYDTHAAALYSYCRHMLPPLVAENGASATSGTFEDLADRDGAKASGGLGDEAAEVVRDTFIVAVSRIGVLRDPNRLGAWLQAVARNECVRRLQARNPGSTVKAADPPGRPPEVAPPDGLKEQVLRACTDITPAGRAYGVSVVHRAGTFDRSGFPRPAEPRGPEWWRRARRPRFLAAVIAFVVPAALAGVIVALTVGGSQRTPDATVALGGGGVPHASTTAPVTAVASPTPHHTAGPHGATPTPLAPTTSGGPSSRPAATPSAGSSSRSPSPSPSPSASPSPSPSPSPTPGVLVASISKLELTSTPGKAVIGTFIVTAENGPVANLVISSPSAKLTISPTSDSLGSGGYVVVTVRAKSKVAFKAKITINPGGLTVTVVLALTVPA